MKKNNIEELLEIIISQNYLTNQILFSSFVGSNRDKVSEESEVYKQVKVWDETNNSLMELLDGNIQKEEN